MGFKTKQSGQRASAHNHEAILPSIDEVLGHLGLSGRLGLSFLFPSSLSSPESERAEVTDSNTAFRPGDSPSSKQVYSLALPAAPYPGSKRLP